MAEQNVDVFDGFEAISNSILPNTNFKTSNTDDDDIPELDDIKDLNSVDVEDDNEDDNSDIDDQGDLDNVDQDESDLTEFEPEITKFFKEKFADNFGMDFGDTEINSVEELVNTIKEGVAEASKPKYANEEIEALNKFVTEGGNLSDYLALSKVGTVDVDLLNSESTNDLKTAITEKLKLQGYNEDRIKRTISRYEDSDLLQDEGEDAIEFLKNHKKDSQEKLLKTQEKMNQEREANQQLFVESVETRIKGLKDIKGFTLTDKQRKELVDYIFKPTADGSTAYQKQYMSNVQNLIESAYFTKYGETLATSAKNAGKTSAVKELHQSLTTKRGKMSSSSQTNQKYKGGADSLFNLIGK